MELINPMIAPIQELPIDFGHKVSLHLLREDLIGGLVGGNKARKLKYNIIQALESHTATVLSFGGAYSNHILALAAAGRQFGLNTVGVIRGEELVANWKQNPTLKKAAEYGMKFEFISRSEYRKKEDPEFIQGLKARWGSVFIIPEGGTNKQAIKGCQEILSSQTHNFNVVCSAVGTGGTLAGIIKSSKSHQEILGFSALAGDFLNKEVQKWTSRTNWSITSDFTLGGYAKINSDLVAFINEFKHQYNTALDPIYTGKMMYGIFERIKAGYFPEKTRILAVHTGGLQGIPGMNQKLLKKGLPLLLT